MSETESLMYEIIERKIIDLVRKAGEKGVIQRELWKELGIDSRRGIRIIRRLEQQGIIKREELYYRGRKTYILKPAIMMKAKVVLKPILDEIPCFYCPFLLKCGSGEINPIQCEKLNEWLRYMANHREE